MHYRHKFRVLILVLVILFVFFVKFTCYGQHVFGVRVTGKCNDCECRGLFYDACRSYEGCLNSSDQFCGSSTYGSCETPGDCVTGGCSGQVCQAKNEEPVVTTCEARECYNSRIYWMACDCVENKCQWAVTG